MSDLLRRASQLQPEPSVDTGAATPSQMTLEGTDSNQISTENAMPLQRTASNESLTRNNNKNSSMQQRGYINDMQQQRKGTQSMQLERRNSLNDTIVTAESEQDSSKDKTALTSPLSSINDVTAIMGEQLSRINNTIQTGMDSSQQPEKEISSSSGSLLSLQAQIDNSHSIDPEKNLFVLAQPSPTGSALTSSLTAQISSESSGRSGKLIATGSLSAVSLDPPGSVPVDNTGQLSDEALDIANESLQRTNISTIGSEAREPRQKEGHQKESREVLDDTIGNVEKTMEAEHRKSGEHQKESLVALTDTIEGFAEAMKLMVTDVFPIRNKISVSDVNNDDDNLLCAFPSSRSQIGDIESTCPPTEQGEGEDPHGTTDDVGLFEDFNPMMRQHRNEDEVTEPVKKVEVEYDARRPWKKAPNVPISIREENRQTSMRSMSYHSDDFDTNTEFSYNQETSPHDKITDNASDITDIKSTSDVFEMVEARQALLSMGYTGLLVEQDSFKFRKEDAPPTTPSPLSTYSHSLAIKDNIPPPCLTIKGKVPHKGAPPSVSEEIDNQSMGSLYTDSPPEALKQKPKKLTLKSASASIIASLGLGASARRMASLGLLLDTEGDDESKSNIEKKIIIKSNKNRASDENEKHERKGSKERSKNRRTEETTTESRKQRMRQMEAEIIPPPPSDDSKYSTNRKITEQQVKLESTSQRKVKDTDDYDAGEKKRQMQAVIIPPPPSDDSKYSTNRKITEQQVKVERSRAQRKVKDTDNYDDWSVSLQSLDSTASMGFVKSTRIIRPSQTNKHTDSTGGVIDIENQRLPKEKDATTGGHCHGGKWRKTALSARFQHKLLVGFPGRVKMKQRCAESCVGPIMRNHRWKVLAGLLVLIILIAIAIPLSIRGSNDPQPPSIHLSGFPSASPSSSLSIAPTLAGPPTLPLYSQAQVISGIQESATAGFSVSFSSDGAYLAVGYRFANIAQVYKRVDGMWTPHGEDILGASAGDKFGWAVSISDNGQRIAVGAPDNSDIADTSGHTRVFQYSDTSSRWEQVGGPITGSIVGNKSGFSVAMSGNGQHVVIGEPAYKDGSGRARIFRLDLFEGTWVQLGL